MVTLKSIILERLHIAPPEQLPLVNLHQLDSDDPANQSVYVTETDEDGNEVQTQEQQYTGTTEDLLSIIKDLRARIEELESNTLQPLYQTVADLPDASEHHGKTAHVHSEGALYFAHAGNWVKLQNA